MATGFQAWRPGSERYFASYGDEAERLRKPWPDDAPFDLIETSYYGFRIPEENIDGHLYHWFHPKLGVASGGLMIAQGECASTFDALYFDYWSFMPLPDDITDCVYANGARVKVIEPFRTMEIGYDNPEEDVSLSFTTRAIMPPAFRGNGGHYTQAMKNSGTLRLRGREYAIGDYFTRDRSWSHPRTEKRLDIPLISWHVIVFDDDLAFHAMAFDSPGSDPVLDAHYPAFRDQPNLLWGYVWRGGELLGVKACEQRTRRKADRVTPEAIDLVIVDEKDERHELAGALKAYCPMPTWPNMVPHLCLTEWRYRGRTGFGDTQVGAYQRYLDRLR